MEHVGGGKQFLLDDVNTGLEEVEELFSGGLLVVNDDKHGWHTSSVTCVVDDAVEPTVTCSSPFCLHFCGDAVVGLSGCDCKHKFIPVHVDDLPT